MNRAQMEEALSKELVSELRKSFYYAFEHEIEVTWSVWCGDIISSRVDGKELTQKQLEFIEHFCTGFLSAMYFVLNKGGL